MPTFRDTVKSVALSYLILFVIIRPVLCPFSLHGDLQAGGVNLVMHINLEMIDDWVSFFYEGMKYILQAKGKNVERLPCVFCHSSLLSKIM